MLADVGLATESRPLLAAPTAMAMAIAIYCSNFIDLFNQ